MKNYGRILMALVFTIGIFGIVVARDANATFILELDDSSTLVSVQDQGSGDLNPALGVITFSGSLGSFIVNVTTSLSKPVLANTPWKAEMDLNSVNVFSGGAGRLLISTSDTGFSLSPGYPMYAETMLIGGTIRGGILTYDKYYDRGNNSFWRNDIHVGTLGPYGPGAFSGTLNTLVPFDPAPLYPGDGFSLTIDIKVDFTGPGTVSFDANDIVAVPEPGTLILLGGGLVSLAVYGKVRFNRRKK